MYAQQIIIFVIFAITLEAEPNELITNRKPTAPTPITEPIELYRSHRLPNATFPLHYFIHIITYLHLNEITFKANTTIDIAVTETTQQIVLHGAHFDNLRVTVYDLLNQKFLNDFICQWNEILNYLIIRFIQTEDRFWLGTKYRLEFLYDGIMSDKSQGLFWLLYDNQQNDEIYIASTQFEPIGARLVFPCYDEPSFKAHFTIRLTHSSMYHSISNMPVHYIEPENFSIITTNFYTTPLMPTYLVAFVISHFDHITTELNEVIQRVYTAPTVNKNYGYKHLHAAVRILEGLETYLGIKYPLKKLDHIILNKNYGLAMENWGLITYTEKCLMLDIDYNEEHLMRLHLEQEQRKFIVIAHEIVHQWFGNLVTPQWWSYAWLKEGFATYFSYIITDMLHPTYKIMDLFLIEVSIFTHKWHDHDTTEPHPMTHYVEAKEDIISMFDIVSYRKAACIIRMFHHAFGEDTFIQAIRMFLIKFQYSNVNEMDLFDCLQDVAMNDVSLKEYHEMYDKWIQAIMLSWSDSKWIPVLMIIRNYEENTITLKQFTKTAFMWIPINFATSSDKNFNVTKADYFMPPIEKVTLNASILNYKLNREDWLIVNKQKTGLYQVIYDDENLLKIAYALQDNPDCIHELNRVDLFDSLARKMNHADIRSVDIIFELLKYLRLELSSLVWKSAVNVINRLLDILYDNALIKPYRQFIRHLIRPIFGMIFHRNRSTAEGMLSHQILALACKFDLPECLEITQRMTIDYMNNKLINQENRTIVQNINLNDPMEMAIICSGLRYMNDNEFNRWMELKLILNEHDFFNCLYCFQKKKHIYHYLSVLIQDSPSDLFEYILDAYKYNYAARPIILQIIHENYKDFVRQPSFIMMFNNLAEYISTKNLKTFLHLLQNIENIELDANNFPVMEDALISQNSSRIGMKLKSGEIFLQKYYDTIEKWLLYKQFSEHNNLTMIQYNSGCCSYYSYDLLNIIKYIFIVNLLLLRLQNG